MHGSLRVLGAAAVVIAGSVIGASPAAAIDNCSSWFDGSRVHAQCTSSAGSLNYVRAVAYCRFQQGGGEIIRYGAWVGVNQISTAECGARRYAYDKSFQKTS